MQIKLYEYTDLNLRNGLALAKRIETLGYEAYLVGGCVRDMVRYQLGQTDKANIHDIDIATNMPIDKLKEHFRTASNNGEKHGTILVFMNDMPYEVTHFRTDGNYSDGRHPDDVAMTESFEADTERRDFTINALGMKWDGTVIDYHGGVEDITNKVIRAVGDADARFKEDALRIVRGIRFAVNFDFHIELDTKGAMSKNSHLVSNVSNERIRDEILKLKDYDTDTVHSFIERLVWYNVYKNIKAFELIDQYELMGKLLSLNTALTKDNLIPILAFTGTENSIDAFMPTREEKKLWKWYQDHRNIWSKTPTPGRYWTWLVELVSGDYESILAMEPRSCGRNHWSKDLPIAKYLAQNMPDMHAINKHVQDMGIASGKAFGEKAAELLEQEYIKLADALPKSYKIVVGNSIVEYKLSSVK